MFEGVIIVTTFFLLLAVIWALMKISGLGSRVADLNETLSALRSKIDTISAPAETLTAVATALQQNVGNLQESISLMNQSITNISTQAMKIESIGKKYEETEALTRRIYNIMIGSYEKGRTGENYLRNTMNELMKIGLVRENVPIGSKVVEYCVVFNDGKLLAIDSKVVATRELEALFDENTSDEDRVKLRESIRNGLKRKIEEVCEYIDPKLTLPCAVMAVPDSIVDLSSEIVPEAVRRNVLVVGYSAVPQLIVYFIRIHGFYSIQMDLAELKDRLMAIQREISKLDDRFFANRFEKPIKTLTNAILRIREVIGGINNLLSLEYREALELPEEKGES
ncbi:DNA recombination protein RmuC [Candidatus Bathyarchaeota archaeon]|nr:DNA recombination protein RmuC [Candidatus Bathyarchaeota archaeon]